MSHPVHCPVLSLLTPCPLPQGEEGAESFDLKVKDDGLTMEDIEVSGMEEKERDGGREGRVRCLLSPPENG